MSEINSALEFEKLRLDAQLRMEQMRQDVRKVVYGTMVVGLAVAIFPFAQQVATSFFAAHTASITTQAEFDRLREQNRLAEQLEERKSSLEAERQATANIAARRTYLEQLAGEARSERIERQIVISEFFSFLAEPDMQPQWVAFRDYLINKQARLNQERAALLANTANPEVTSADRTSALERLQQIDRLENPGARAETPRYNLPLPPPLPGESSLGREMLTLALNEINSGIHEVNQRGRVEEYWRPLGSAIPTQERTSVPWSGAFTSWIIFASGNPHGLRLSASTAQLWRTAAEKGFTRLRDRGPPVGGDLVFVARDAAGAEAMRTGEGFVLGTTGIVYASTPEGVTVIAGNIRNAVNLVTWRLDDPRLVGFVHLPDPISPTASRPPNTSGDTAR